MLPKEFWEANEFGVKGGIESAFMSTTLNEKVAISYASSGNGTGFVFEIPQGMVDRGADIGTRISRGPNTNPPTHALHASPSAGTAFLPPSKLRFSVL